MISGDQGEDIAKVKSCVLRNWGAPAEPAVQSTPSSFNRVSIRRDEQAFPSFIALSIIGTPVDALAIPCSLPLSSPCKYLYRTLQKPHEHQNMYWIRLARIATRVSVCLTPRNSRNPIIQPNARNLPSIITPVAPPKTSQQGPS